MTRRHRSEYPTDMQEVGDILELWDGDGFLVDLSIPLEPDAGMFLVVSGLLAGLNSRTRPKDSKP